MFAQIASESGQNLLLLDFSRGLWWDQARDAAVVTSWVGLEKGKGAAARVCVCMCLKAQVCMYECFLSTCGVVQEEKVVSEDGLMMGGRRWRCWEK